MFLNHLCLYIVCMIFIEKKQLYVSFKIGHCLSGNIFNVKYFYTVSPLLYLNTK